MHILTGMLLAALAGRKKGEGRTAVTHLPQIRLGPVQTVHALPGRIRFRIPSLVGDPTRKDILLERIPGISGVESVEASHISGSVVIRYRDEEIHPDLLFAAIIRLLGLEKELDKPPRPIFTREIQLLGQSLNRAVYEKSGGIIDLWSAFFLVLAAVGIQKMLAQKGMSFPTGFTLVWWALNGFYGRKEKLKKWAGWTLQAGFQKAGQNWEPTGTSRQQVISMP